MVIEAQKPGALAGFGLGYDVLKEINPSIVFATLSGYGSTGPYRDMPSHGIAYDTWAGIVQPVTDDDGFTRIPKDMPNVGINVGPMVAAMGILAGIIKARETGVGCEMELAQSDAAAYMDWYRIESERAYLRPEDEVTGNPADNYERRPAGLAGMWEGVRYQMYEASDGHVLFMASAQEWRVVHEADLDFEDAAGRCAQLLHLVGERRRGGHVGAVVGTWAPWWAHERGEIGGLDITSTPEPLEAHRHRGSVAPMECGAQHRA